MEITPTQDEDVIEQTIELPKPDMPLEDYILVGYSEKDKGTTEQIKPDPIVHTSFKMPESVRLIIKSVSKNLNISKTKATLFLTKSGLYYIEHLITRYSNLSKCCALLNEIYEKNLDTKIKQSHDAYINELERKFDYSIDKKGLMRVDMRMFWWVSNAVGRHSETLCLKKEDIIIATIYYSACMSKGAVSDEFKEKCRHDLVGLEKYLITANEYIIEILSESAKKNIVGEIAVKGQVGKFSTIVDKIKTEYPSVYETIISTSLQKKDTKEIEHKEEETEIIEETKTQNRTVAFNTANMLVSHVFNNVLIDFSVTLYDGSVLIYKKPKSDIDKNKK